MGEYPRVLISGQFFHTRSGSGITLTNLFWGWDKNKLAATASYIANPSFDLCNNYYQIGSKELVLRFPFNLKVRTNLPSSGKCLPVDHEFESITLHKAKKTVLRRIYDSFLFSSGLIHYRSTFRMSSDFLSWVRSFDPEIIYSQLSSLEEIRIVTALHKELRVPLVIHIMDDWPKTIGRRYFPRILWTRIIQSEFLYLFSTAKSLLSISDTMSEEYYKRYRLQFMPFHNPISIRKWLPYSKVTWEIEGNFKILYTGRIGRANGKAIIFMAHIINELNLKEGGVTLDIYTPDFDNKHAISIRNLSGVNVRETISYTEMPFLLSSYDLLFLPLDFDRDGIRFAKLSMPTKTSEYMISGTPILIYSPEETAVAKFFSKNNCGYCVNHEDKEELKSAVQFLMGNKEYRQIISTNAMELAKEKFDDEKVRAKFRQVIFTAAR
jgi:glycosyltransferase involved in cell wall biosynthesis